MIITNTGIPITVKKDGGGDGGGIVGGGGGGGTTEVSYIAGKNLREGNNVTLRPTILTSAHLYNLRNQGWAIPTPSFDGDDTQIDLISQFVSAAGVYPSNADYPGPFTYAKTDSDKGSKYILRFNAEDCVKNPLSNSAAELGHFIIDLLNRGDSRKSAYAQMRSQYPQDTYNIANLPTDQSPDGATCIAEYAGRIFFSGFSGVLNSGDTSSPQLSSYVLFSQLVTDSYSIFYCYQQNDPTSNDQSDLLDTDGGFIRVEGAYNINSLKPIQDGLAVLAENGVWVIRGGGGSGFSATNYEVTKVTTAGCIAPNSIVPVGTYLLYWGRDGIYNLHTNEFGDFVSDNITRKSIHTLYNSVNAEDQKSVYGAYDEFEQKVKWVYGNRYDSDPPTYELILDVQTGAFTKFSIGRVNTNRFPMLVCGVTTNPFTLANNTSDVTLNDGVTLVVLSDGDQVVVNNNVDKSLIGSREVQYLIITSVSPTITFTFGNYTNTDHYDWKSFDGVGIDAKSYMVTGILSGNDFQRDKNMVYLTAHFSKTETGLVDDGTGSGDLTFDNPSSCLLQAQWNWSNSASTKKWGPLHQIYRLSRPYFPTDPSNFDNGFYVVETKNKVRGGGKVLSLLFQSEPGKHCEILGWSVDFGVEGNV